MLLSNINKHPFDSRIRFRDEGHKYWIDDDDKDLISSTTFIHTFFEHFDEDGCVKKILNSSKYKDPTYEYYNMSKKEIKQKWKDASRLGTEMHKDIEDFYNGINIKNDTDEFKQFLDFYNDHKHLKIYRTEWLIFSDILKITGSIDATFINEDGTLTLGDWKRSKDIKDESFGGKTGKFPLTHIPDCNYYQYSLQLNLYRTILEKFYNQKIKEMFLVVLHPKNKNEYKKIMVNKMDKEIQMMLDNRKQELLKKGYSKNKLDKVQLNYTLKDADVDVVVEEDIKPIKSFLRNKTIKKEEEHKSDLNFIKEEEKVKKNIKLDKLTYDSLSNKQKQAYNLIKNGYSIFLTGAGGCGKTSIIKLFYTEFKNRKNIGITSTTGTSSILIGGSTIHSYLGIGLGTSDVETIYMNIKNRSIILNRWIDLDVLIIDEISMLSPHLFDKLEHLARVIRKNDLPFGGIQLIITGDFLQLPCVNSSKFCFQSKSWGNCIKNIVYLNENFRQDDPKFQKCLGEVRIGELSKDSIQILKSRENIKLENELGILPTKIYALNRDVDTENQIEINKLFKKNNDLEFYEYQMSYEIIAKKGFKGNVEEKIIKNCSAPAVLELCVGAQVMLLWNMDLEAKLANGSRGVVIKFIDDLPLVRFLTGEERIIDNHTWKIQENGVDIVSITQIPLKIAYAISIHKCCQENTLIFTNTGIKRISKISSDNFKDQMSNTSLDINISIMGKEKYNNATQIYKGDVENTIEIVTKRGYRIEGSYRHPILTFLNNKEEWKILPNIKKGDYIVLKNNINCYGNNISTNKFISNYKLTSNSESYQIPKFIDYKLCYLIGALIGDGTYSVKKDYPIEFTQDKKERDVINYFKQYFQYIFDTDIKEYSYENENICRLLKNSKHIRDFLYWCGLDYVTNENKTIPWVIFENDKESQIACLKGLFDTDGGVNNCIHYTTTSKQLAIDIQNLLLNNGIMSSLKKLTNNSKQAYRIQILGNDGYLYFKLIGFNCKSKQKKLEKLYSKIKQSKIKSNIGLIPNGKELVQHLRNEIYNKHGKINKVLFGDFSKFISRIIGGKSNLQYYDLNYIYNNIKNIDEYGDSGKLISYLFKNNLFLDMVDEINNSKKQLYDLYVPETNTFIGNGIINHNSQGITVDYAIVDMEGIFQDGMAYVALSRVTSKDGLSIKNFRLGNIFANEKAVEFYKNL